MRFLCRLGIHSYTGISADWNGTMTGVLIKPVKLARVCQFCDKHKWIKPGSRFWRQYWRDQFHDARH